MMKNILLSLALTFFFMNSRAQETEFINGTCKINVPFQDTTCQIGHKEGDRDYYRPETIGVRVEGYEGKKLGIDYKINAVEMSVKADGGTLDFTLESPSGKIVNIYRPATQVHPDIGNPYSPDCSDNLVISDTASQIIGHCGCEGPCTGSRQTHDIGYNRHPEKGLVKFQDSTDVNGLWTLYYCNPYVMDATLVYFNIVIEPMSAVGVDEETLNHDALLIPNPAQKQFQINTRNNNAAQVTVYSLTGQLIYNNKHYLPSEFINTSQWPNGIYTVHILQQSSTVVKKLLVE